MTHPELLRFLKNLNCKRIILNSTSAMVPVLKDSIKISFDDKLEPNRVVICYGKEKVSTTIG